MYDLDTFRRPSRQTETVPVRLTAHSHAIVNLGLNFTKSMRYQTNSPIKPSEPM